MGFVSELLGRLTGSNGRTEPRDIGAVELALARCSAERAAANKAIIDAVEARRQLIIRDATDAEIAALDTETDKHRLTLERCDVVQPELIAELQGLRTVARQKAWADFARRDDEASLEHLATMRAALVTLKVKHAIRDEADRAGFGAEASHFVPAPNIVDEPLLFAFEESAERARESRTRPTPRQAPTPAAVAPAVPAPRRAIAQKAVASARPAAVQSRKAPRPLLHETAGEGEVLVTVIRPGLETLAGVQTRYGDVIALPAAKASEAVRNNAVVYVDEPAAIHVVGAAMRAESAARALAGGTAVEVSP